MKYFLLSLFLLILSCNKYEDGGNVSIRSFGKRLQGDYVLTKFYKDGVDLTYEFVNSPGFCPELSIGYQRPGYFSSYYTVSKCDTNGSFPANPWIEDEFYGECSWIDKKKKLKFGSGLFILMDQNPDIRYEYEWTINRLRGKDLWINYLDENGVKYMVMFEKID